MMASGVAKLESTYERSSPSGVIVMVAGLSYRVKLTLSPPSVNRASVHFWDSDLPSKLGILRGGITLHQANTSCCTSNLNPPVLKKYSPILSKSNRCKNI
jgi:hypothetical protein